MQFLQFIKQLWLSVRSEYWFVPVKGVFFGTMITQLANELKAGSMDWSLAGWEHILAVSLVAALISLEGLITPAPGATPVKN